MVDNEIFLKRPIWEQSPGNPVVSGGLVLSQFFREKVMTDSLLLPKEV